MNIKEIDVFSPLILIPVVLIYVLFGIIAFNFQMRGLTPISNITYLYIIYGLLLFITGIYSAKIIEKRYYQSINIKKSFQTILDRVENNHYFQEKIILTFVLVALLIEVVNLITMPGIPLLSGLLKARSFNTLTIISYSVFLIAINLLLAKFYQRKYLIIVMIGVILFAATGYRALTIAILLSIMITLFYTRPQRLNFFLAISTLIIVIGSLVGYVACLSIEWQQWNVNPLSLVFIRAGYTLSVLDMIIRLPTTHPGVLSYYVVTGYFQSVDPRLVLGQLVMGYQTSITGTIFGPVILEAGTIGLGLQMFFLGLILELLHYLQRIKRGIYTGIYALGLAHTIIWVETGPMDLMVWIYFIIMILIIIKGSLNLKKK